MGDSEVRERADRTQRAARPAFDLLESKLRRPQMRPGTLGRSPLIERLAGGDPGPIVSVVAPAGYGKTTLLSQWADRSSQSFAWVSADEADNDPKVFLSYVAEALDAVEPIGERVFDALASPSSSVPGSVIPRICAAFWSMTSPVVLVLDDVHVLHDRECQAAVSLLAEHVPEDSRIVLAGRTRPPLRIGRLRAEGQIMEIGASDLSLTLEEASSLLRDAGIALGEDDVAELYQRSEGWPVGLYLAALYLREGGPLPRAAVSFTGGDRFINDYMESEFLSRISQQQQEFLTRTAVLDRLCGPLCESVLDQPGSRATLVDLAQSNLLLVQLDREGEWYRYHHLFRDMLLGQLHRLEPELMPVLYRRAAEWFESNGAPGEALDYRMKAGDTDAAAQLVGALAFATYQRGRAATVERWFGWLNDHGDMEKYPAIAVLAAALSAVTGKAAEADRWATIAERGADIARLPDGSSSIEPWLALIRALLCRGGVEQMRADAEFAAAAMAPGSFWRSSSIVLLGIAHLMAGDPDGADVFFEDTVAEVQAGGAAADTCLALAERSLLAAARGAWDLGERHVSEARSVAREARVEDYPTLVIMYAAAARMALHLGDRPRARAELTRAQRLRPALTHATPHLATQTRLELAKCHLALADFAAARTLLREVEDILRRRPGLGVFAVQAEDLRVELSQARGSFTPGASALTAAELRLLPMLATHMSFPEIATEMFLSKNTIKSEVTSLYRKLGASSRNQAVTRARALGLLEGLQASLHLIEVMQSSPARGVMVRRRRAGRCAWRPCDSRRLCAGWR
jgi:LuxR family maltose regulon positive regulatory protein